ncbi:MAG: GNAT family N-acetyltransferase, partial [Ktedonobacterales bacterium]
TWAGVSYYVPDGVVGPADYPDVVALDWSSRAEIERFDPEMTSFGWPVYAVLRDGAVVATCVSTREIERAGEAWVQTARAYRGRGYARQVTAAWGDALLRQGKVAFYSHALDNAASAGVARTLRLAPYLHDVGYT